jgi:hypothetical protein
MCDEHGIGSSDEYCGDSDAHLGRINVFTTGRQIRRGPPREQYARHE